MEIGLGITGNIASIIGLGLSVWIIFNTDKLKKALSDARQSLLKRFEREETLDDVSSLIHKLEQIETFAINEKWEVVGYLLDDALRTYPIITNRWQLPQDAEIESSHLSLDRVRREVRREQPEGRRIRNRIHEAIILLRNKEAQLKQRKEEHYV